MKYRLFKYSVIIVASFIFIFGLAGPTIIGGMYLPVLSNKDKLISGKSQGVLLYDRNGKLIATYGDPLRRRIISLSDVPAHTKHAILAMEDRDFYSHGGFSLRGISRAAIENIQTRSLHAGGSTITQQVAKNTILTSSRTFWRKYQELIIAILLERMYKKDDILSMYINTIYFGQGAYGIEEAAETYFNKHASELSIAESSYLAGLIAAPSLYGSSININEGGERQKLVVKSMLAAKYITQDQAVKVLSTPLEFKNAYADSLGTAPHFALYVYDLIRAQFGEQYLRTAGLSVTTTLDSSMQEIAEKSVREHVKGLNFRRVTNGAAVVLDPTSGEILAMVGSHDWFDDTNGKINMAVTPRQVGSSFKPIIYAAAFQKGIVTPTTLLPDLPKTYQKTWKPQNYDKTFRGPVLPRRALSNSLNLPAVEVMSRVGLPTGMEYARAFGVKDLKDISSYGLSFVLGTAEVSLLDMTDAYAVFANNGKRTSVSAFKEVKNKYGDVVYSYKPQKTKVIDESTAFMINSILSDSRSRREAFGNLLDTTVGAAVKTGTTEFYKDSLTFGYTPNLVVGVWVGNNDAKAMDSIAGSVGAAPIMKDLIETFAKDRPKVSFDRPSTVMEKVVCTSSRLLPFTATPSAIKEFISAEHPVAAGSCSPVKLAENKPPDPVVPEAFAIEPNTSTPPAEKKEEKSEKKESPETQVNAL